jgi:tyrosyl-tRNA synthetase
MGGATGRIGDPSGKDTERELKSYDELDRNLARQVDQMKRLLDFDDPATGAILVNNLDFYKDMSVLAFLRDVGKHFTINYMMSKESVKRRVETGMSYTEFSYQLLQAYDYLCLHKAHGVTLQMGGSDQWGNITSGTEFIRRTLPDAEVFALTSPLLTKADGKKFGKSEEGNIWLDPAMTSPYKFYQFWLNVDDRDLAKLLRIFSLRERAEIESLEAAHANDPRALKALLAEELTTRIHGRDAFASAYAVTRLLFTPQAGPDQLEALADSDFELMMQEIPSAVLPVGDLADPANVVDLLAAAGLMPSKSEVRRAVQQNAVSINLRKVTDIAATVSRDDLLHGRFLLVEQGKKNKRILKFL